MRASFIIAAVLAVSTSAMPIAIPTNIMALLPRQDQAGSTSTSVSNNSGLLGVGLTGGSAAAADDGSSTSSTSTSECNLLDCSSGASAAGPSNSSAASSSSSLIGKFARFLQ